MLRELAHPHLRAVLEGFRSTVTATPSASNDFCDRIFTTTREAAGKHLNTRTVAAQRIGPMVASVAADCGLDSRPFHDTAPTVTALNPAAATNTGTADEGTMHGLAIRYDSANTDRVAPLQSIVAPFRSPRLMGFRVATNAIASGAKQGTLSVASSVYTFTWTRAFGRAPIIVASAIGATAANVKITSTAVDTGVISAAAVDGTPGDRDFCALVFGSNAINDTQGVLRPVVVPQIAPRLEVFTVDGSGTAAISVGSTDATLTDNGTGDWTLTFTKAFKRAPICVVTGATRAQLQTAPTTTAVRILGFNAAGSAAADQVFTVFCLGYDDDVEI